MNVPTNLRRDRYQVEPKLVNPRADQTARRLMAYLCDTYGKHMLTGQQIGVHSTPEMEILHRETGFYPAVGGFDFMDYSPGRANQGAVCHDTDHALRWWEEGGIVTFCWHWTAPRDMMDLPNNKKWEKGFYTEATTFDVEQAMSDPSSEGYQLLVRDIDAIALQLKRLMKAGVPVLWRPLHEASGGWFWWGAKGPKPYLALWGLLYERLTHHHELNNLIWVWNGQHKDWYPGDETVDIIGEDIYPPKRDYSPQADRFDTALAYTSSSKIIALSENGILPDPDQMLTENVRWAWNCTWYGEFLYTRDEEGKLPYSEEYTEHSMLQKLYRHPFSITRDQLPNLKTYRLP
ncbi:glycosyl hydrolase [Gorillibacterium timonense]|uniref:glycosyl hydrolase n=1 Tax=Gorillibacterium timonense TaxID=1689269 RepID=UPI00071D9808|nr:glycosyl hydrolase [Gorillibacterium timonense]